MSQDAVFVLAVTERTLKKSFISVEEKKGGERTLSKCTHEKHPTQSLKEDGNCPARLGRVIH